MIADISDSRQHEPAILIIDDDSNNLAIVSALLEEYSYTIYVAEDGESGISRALLTRPDMILLDVLMPGMDGFETCQRLKSIEETREIPVIFMTALAETEQKVRGFESGAVDYITKPIQREEVLARVGVHLRIRYLAKKLQDANLLLEKRVEERTLTLARTNEELKKEVAVRTQAQEALAALNESLEQRVAEEVEKNRQKDRILFQNARLSAMAELLNNIGHQWRQPLNSIALLLQGFVMEAKEGRLDRESVQECVDRCMKNISYLSSTINLFQSLFALEGEPRAFDPSEMVERALSLVRASYQQGGINVKFVNRGCIPMTGFGGAFSQAVLSILINAKEVLVERGVPEPCIEILCDSGEGRNMITIGDNAGGIREDALDKVFDPYFTTKFQARGTGLGLYIAKMIIEQNMHGTLSVRNAPKGAEFLIELPA